MRDDTKPMQRLFLGMTWRSPRRQAIPQFNATTPRTGHLLLFTCTAAAVLTTTAIGSRARAEPPGESEELPAIGKEAFQAISQFYAYDAEILLDARIVERKERETTLRELIVLRGSQGFLVTGYFERPSSRSGPLPCVLLLHGWSGSKSSWWDDDNYISGGNLRRELLEAGFAILALDAQCHGQRSNVNDFALPNPLVNAEGHARKGYFMFHEIVVQTVVDYRRALDYLATRDDVDMQRVGLAGYSMGGLQAVILAAVESRVRVSVACVVPSNRDRFSPLAPQNYLHGIGGHPLLLLMGRSDPLCSADDARRLHHAIGRPTTQLKFFDAEHRLPAAYVPHAVQWIQQHLNPQKERSAND